MGIRVGDICLVGGVTVVSCYQLANFARKVGAARGTFKVEPPRTDGPEEFLRVYRAHQNSLELFPVYMGTMWTSAIFLHQVPASIVGLVYLYSRQKYFSEYSKDAKKRVQPFVLGVQCLRLFLLMSTVGVANTISVKYFDYDVLLQLVGKVMGLFGNSS